MENTETAVGKVTAPPREEPESFDDLVKLILSLTAKQMHSLGMICCGDDSCLNPNTAKVLHDKALINYELVGGLYRAEMHSLRIHLAWCKAIVARHGHEPDFPDEFRNPETM